MPRIAVLSSTAVALLLVAIPAHTQTVPAPTWPATQPYTAEFKITFVQTLADGTNITKEGTETRARTSAGITALTDSDISWQMGPMLGTSGGVHDIDGTILANWYSVTHEGRIFKLPPREQRHGCWLSPNLRLEFEVTSRRPPDKIVYNQTTRAIERIPAPVQGSRPQFADLGTVKIQGVEANGQRITRTVAVGEASNDHTIVTVEEDWMAPSLGLMLRETIDDPRVGKRTRELVNITLGEPDPSLFQPPRDYQVTTEELHPVACTDRHESAPQQTPAATK